MAHRDIMHTSNPCYEYSFCWTIDDFHTTSFVVQGPAFSPIPGCSDQFCFQVEFRLGDQIAHTNVKRAYFFFRLLDLTSNVHHRSVHGTVALQNTEETLCDETFGRIKIKKSIDLMLYYIYHDETEIYNEEEGAMSILSLSGLDGKLTLHGSLTFTGFLATSSIYSISVRKPLKDCGELANDFKSLYESGSGSDVTFTVGNQLLPAHKLVLGARSEVLAKMFDHGMLESNTNNVIIPDIDPDTFKKFLLFLYTGVLEDSDEGSPKTKGSGQEESDDETVVTKKKKRKISSDEESSEDSDSQRKKNKRSVIEDSDQGDDDHESLLKLYAVAHKYQVKSLLKMCVGLLGNRLTSDSLCESLVVADLYNDEEFKGIVKVLLRQNFFDVVGTAKWVEIVTTKPELAKEVTDYMKPVQN